MTQRAKLRRFAFIRRPSRVRSGIPGQWIGVNTSLIHTLGPCRCQAPSCQGNQASFCRSIAVFSRFASHRSGAWLSILRARARCSTVTPVPRQGNLAPASVRRNRPPDGPAGHHGGMQRLELAQFHRPLIAGPCDSRARAAAGPFPPAARKKPRCITIVPPGPQPPSASARRDPPPLRERLRRGAGAAPAGRGVRIQPLSASAGISARMRTRVNRGSRLERSSAKEISALRNVATAALSAR